MIRVSSCDLDCLVDASRWYQMIYIVSLMHLGDLVSLTLSLLDD